MSVHPSMNYREHYPLVRQQEGKKLRFSFNRLVMSLDFSVEYNKVMGG